METNKLRKKLSFFLFSSIAIILVVWVSMQIQNLRNLNRINLNYSIQVSERIIDNLEMIFQNLDYTAIALSTHEDVKKFVTEEDSLSYHDKSEDIRDLISDIYRPEGLVEDILIYDMEGVFYRFLGDLSSTNAKEIGKILGETKNQSHIIINLSGIQFIGYISAIYEDDKQTGSIIFLINGKVIENMFNVYDPIGYLEIGLVADDKVIASNNPRLKEQTIQEIEEKSDFFRRESISITPFEILLANNPSVFIDNYLEFLVFSLFNFASLVLIFFLLYRWINNRFFKPMVQIISNADQMKITTDYQPFLLTGEEEFDKVIYRINEMMKQVENHNNKILDMKLQMYLTETEKQTAINISLKKQINAHFMINTLNVIKRLSQKAKYVQAGEMCDNLSFLLRYANNEEDYINGMEEMFVLEKYAKIMQIRYPNRFDVEFDIEDKMYDIVLPRMLIQPILENAFIHSKYANDKNIRITILAYIENGEISITVKDNGCGMDYQTLSMLQNNIWKAPQTHSDNQGVEHIALLNIQKRIVLLFGEAYGISIESIKEEGTTVKIILPLL